MDESISIVLFVCVPLFLLMIAAIIVRYRATPGTAISLSTFSVDVSSVGHSEVNVAYRDASFKLFLDGEICNGKRLLASRVFLRIPKEMADEDARKVVPNIALALGKLRFEYVIYKSLEMRGIPTAERDTAIQQLGENGIRLDHSQRVTKTALTYWRRVLGGRGMTMEQMAHRIAQAKGISENVEVLAQSE